MDLDLLVITALFVMVLQNRFKKGVLKRKPCCVRIATRQYMDHGAAPSWS